MDEPQRLFWDLAEPLLAVPGVERSTMMGHECLRNNGEFFAMVGTDGALIVKLAADRVTELIDRGAGREFAPSGRPFREWLAVPEVDESMWQALLDEAKAFSE